MFVYWIYTGMNIDPRSAERRCSPHFIFFLIIVCLKYLQNIIQISFKIHTQNYIQLILGVLSVVYNIIS